MSLWGPSLTNNRPVVQVPRLNGRVEVPVDNSGKTGLTRDYSNVTGRLGLGPHN
jgi:hypothetical protein